MQYLRNNAIVAATFLAIGGVTVFVPLPEGFGFLPVLILLAALGSFFTASNLAIPEKYSHSLLAVTLCFISSVGLTVFVVLATMTMVVAVRGCL